MSTFFDERPAKVTTGRMILSRMQAQEDELEDACYPLPITTQKISGRKLALPTKSTKSAASTMDMYLEDPYSDLGSDTSDEEFAEDARNYAVRQYAKNSIPASCGLCADELSFFKAWTGIISEEELISHILRVRDDVFERYPYPCIRYLTFARLRIHWHPAYERLLSAGQNRHSLFLDLGSCFGTDVRKLVVDGFPPECILASDLRPDFWDLGQRLFKELPGQSKLRFLPGDIFDNNFLDVRNDGYRAPDLDTASPSTLATASSLTRLRGRVSLIHVASLFHLFDEHQQLNLAQRLAALLSPEPGSFIFGSHGCRLEEGYRVSGSGSSGPMSFRHSEQSWKDMWDGGVFLLGTVHVETRVEQVLTGDALDNGDRKSVV